MKNKKWAVKAVSFYIVMHVSKTGSFRDNHCYNNFAWLYTTEKAVSIHWCDWKSCSERVLSDHVSVCYAVVTCDIKLFRNNFELIFCFISHVTTISYIWAPWRSGLSIRVSKCQKLWLHVKQNTEIISKIFQCFLLNVTTSEISSATEIISKLFPWHWTCWKIFVCCNKPLK